MGLYERYFKRPLDIILSGLALVILSPFFLVIALLVRIKLGSPIFFKQERPGKDEKIFTMYKFRTMTNETNKEGKLLPNNIRLTAFGRFLRSTSLDELPELFNIFIGDMSIVGPRPLLIEYLSLYDEIQRKRHNVRPGLSGLAQINGRNTISWSEKFNFDVKYVSNITFLLDLKIVLQTIFKVFKRDGVNKNKSVTMEKFTGNKNQK